MSHLLGRRLSLYWDGDQAWFDGIIVQYHSASTRHRIEYEDGDRQWHILEDEKYRWLDSVPAAAARSHVHSSRHPLHRRNGEGSASPPMQAMGRRRCQMHARLHLARLAFGPMHPAAAAVLWQTSVASKSGVRPDDAGAKSKGSAATKAVRRRRACRRRRKG